MAKEFLVERWKKNDSDDDDGNIAQSEMAWCNNGFDDDDDEHWTNSKICKNQNTQQGRTRVSICTMYMYACTLSNEGEKEESTIKSDVSNVAQKDFHLMDDDAEQEGRGYVRQYTQTHPQQ